ncbi:exodeoxyribonuclease III [Terasakiispira papahanaumokuakeensis]|uniref:Exodeoxyribonuclease III n=1 Tax=Terasakiispira papahanaumokuakeensis TaxID=197479 RepID=A0A1E2VDR9_9GAMM|nr:exodeoxyribonuclease III [Terasakiispira papahanaumokuakeensis]ODC04805.1 exodeoxyribonuclease III [Terasakiispira papahanaumokuakeensis]
MKIINLNVNGIMQAVDKGFLDWLSAQDADVVCVQDIQAKSYELPDEVYQPEGYEGYFFDAEQDHFSGVGIYCRRMPKAIMTGLGFELADREGRFMQADFDKVSVASFLMPSGENPAEKQLFMEQYLEFLRKLRRKRREYIICGTWNIAHKTIDLADWQSNQNSIGFSPEERAWMDQVFGPLGYIDTFREINRDADAYTFWPAGNDDRLRSEGWRVDYQVVGPNLQKAIKRAWIDDSVKFSNHAALVVEYDL